ncbi:4-hydroxy-2-oxovalerate aldolase [Salicibibacter kimchii]|uniref:4-hydroxy-2-oxovalerate aldolase n=1 Tax=Salicibibacter kimchii TaxID=2099786 RepID=A0A345C1W7_9BACI|nr:4-hydroxy-2-oxovalerate aldolase [Salicibibacter kimchii]AXF57198.1 4-hydroxy-2-oxovalerate aldolase [Salicibibacter kimchii]
MTKQTDIKITEVALRDGSHAISHQYTVDQVKSTAKALNEARVPYIEVAHGDGLGGSSLQYGFSKTDEFKLIEAAVSVADFSKIAVLLLPGIGTIEDLKEAAALGAKMARVATHVTEADVSEQHIQTAKELGMETVGFLMMSHMVSVEKLVEQAKLMESYGADTVYVVDSAGALLPHEVKERIKALRQALSIDIGFHGHNNLSLAMGNTLAAIEEGATRIDGSIRCLGADTVYVVDSAGALLPHEVKERIKALRQALSIDIGFHGHNNLSLAMGNTLAAIEEGATRIDGSIRCLGAGAGNTQTEVLIGVLDKMGIETGVDLYKIMDVAEDIVAPILQQPQEINRDSLTLGYAGVYSSFLLHANRAAEKFLVESRDILVELGKREIIGGQEDMIIDVAAELAETRKASVQS